MYYFKDGLTHWKKIEGVPLKSKKKSHRSIVLLADLNITEDTIQQHPKHCPYLREALDKSVIASVRVCEKILDM